MQIVNINLYLAVNQLKFFSIALTWSANALLYYLFDFLNVFNRCHLSKFQKHLEFCKCIATNLNTYLLDACFDFAVLNCRFEIC